MAGNSKDQGGLPVDTRKKARIEIIPLIDVIFFLLATFVLFTLSLNRIQSITVDLPKAELNSKPNPDDDSVTLQISEDGSAFWNKEAIDYDEIYPKLVTYKQSSPNPKVLIAGDDKAKLGPTVLALDAVRRAGITQVSVETTYRPTGK